MDTKLKFLADFKQCHDARVNFCRMMQRGFEREMSIAEDFLRKAVDSCDFCMCIRPKDFKKALEDNELKELFEIGHGGATVGGIEVRRIVMKNLYDLDSEKYPIKEMPKYGILVGKDKYRDLISDPDIFYHYGSIMLTFKKENLLHRTTMTVGSSLQYDESRLKTPTFVTDPKFICIKGYPKDPLIEEYFLGLRFFVDNLIKLRKLSPTLPNMMSDLASGMNGFENFELQYFGKITISEDVKEVCYMPLGDNDEEEIAELKPLLKKYGLECKRLDEMVFDIPQKFSTKSQLKKKQAESKEEETKKKQIEPKEEATEKKQAKSKKKQIEPKEEATEKKQAKSKKKQVEPKEEATEKKQAKSKKKQVEPKEEATEKKQAKSKKKQAEPKEEATEKKQAKPKKKQAEPKEEETEKKQAKTKKKQAEPKEEETGKKQAKPKKKQAEPKEEETEKKQAKSKKKQTTDKEK